MDEKSPIKSFLKGFLGFNKAPAEPLKKEPPQLPVPEAVPPPSPTPEFPKTPKSQSEAYLHRKKGRISHGNKMGYLRAIIDYLLIHGEAAPRVMAKDLNLPKSTLIYNLNRLSELGLGKQRHRDEIPPDYVLKLTGGKRLERVGGSKYVRYRLMEKTSVPEKPSDSPN